MALQRSVYVQVYLPGFSSRSSPGSSGQKFPVEPVNSASSVSCSKQQSAALGELRGSAWTRQNSWQDCRGSIAEKERDLKQVSARARRGDMQREPPAATASNEMAWLQ